MKAVRIVLSSLAMLGLMAAPVLATQNENPDKSVTITGNCDDTANVEVYAGNTNRNWRVNLDEKWVGFYQSQNWENVATPVSVQWYHESEKAWKDADPSYVTVVKAEDCPVEEPVATPSSTPKTPEAVELPDTGTDFSWVWFVAGAVLGGFVVTLYQYKRK